MSALDEIDFVRMKQSRYSDFHLRNYESILMANRCIKYTKFQVDRHSTRHVEASEGSARLQPPDGLWMGINTTQQVFCDFENEISSCLDKKLFSTLYLIKFGK